MINQFEILKRHSKNCTGELIIMMRLQLLHAQVCYLSCDRLLLGNVPMMTCTRRVVTISNTSTHCMQYTWHVTNECHAQVNHYYTWLHCMQYTWHVTNECHAQVNHYYTWLHSMQYTWHVTNECHAQVNHYYTWLHCTQYTWHLMNECHAQVKTNLQQIKFVVCRFLVGLFVSCELIVN